MMLFDDLPQTKPQAPKISGSRAWETAVRVLMNQGGMSNQRARVFIGKLKKQKLSDDDLLSISRTAEINGTLDPISYFTKAAHEALNRRSAVIAIEAPSEARQRAWMEDWKANPNGWRRHERGPMPGEHGCRVSERIQKEYV